MTEFDKNLFDALSNTSYLFRVLVRNAGFELTCMNLNGTGSWHLYYENAIVGAVTTRNWSTEEDSCTFTNLRLYKYFQSKFPKIKDFLMSEFYEIKDGKRQKFNFDKANKYLTELRAAAETLVKHEDEEEDPDTIGDSIARLREFCDEFDEKFSNNTLFKDVRALLGDYDRVIRELQERNNYEHERSDPEERSAPCGAETDQPSDEDSGLGEHSEEPGNRLCEDQLQRSSQGDRQRDQSAS